MAGVCSGGESLGQIIILRNESTFGNSAVSPQVHVLKQGYCVDSGDGRDEKDCV